MHRLGIAHLVGTAIASRDLTDFDFRILLGEILYTHRTRTRQLTLWQFLLGEHILSILAARSGSGPLLDILTDQLSFHSHRILATTRLPKETKPSIHTHTTCIAWGGY